MATELAGCAVCGGPGNKRCGRCKDVSWVLFGAVLGVLRFVVLMSTFYKDVCSGEWRVTQESYCSQACQKTAWPQHKNFCGKIRNAINDGKGRVVVACQDFAPGDIVFQEPSWVFSIHCQAADDQRALVVPSQFSAHTVADRTYPSIPAGAISNSVPRIVLAGAMANMMKSARCCGSCLGQLNLGRSCFAAVCCEGRGIHTPTESGIVS